MSKICEHGGFFKCKFCFQRLESPITLPCGETVCESHVLKLNKGVCKFCDKRHVRPDDGFQINKLVVDLMKRGLKSLVDDTENNAYSAELYRVEQENVIFEYFLEVKRQVDLRRETLKMEIDEYSNGLISQINKIQKDCIKYFNDSNHMRLKIDRLEKGLDSLDESMKLELEKYQKEHEDHESNYRKYEFQFEKFNVKNVFGSLENKSMAAFYYSNILDKHGFEKLVDLCEFKKNQKFKLIYQATTDEFGATEFHEKCDGIPNTLTVIKNTAKNIFGGYTAKPWNSPSHSHYTSDPNAFIFSLVNSKKKPFKTACSNPSSAIYNCSDNGPCFGSGDLWIKSNSNINQESYADFSYSYENEIYEYGTSQAKTILTGSEHFQAIEIEVYQIIS